MNVMMKMAKLIAAALAVETTTVQHPLKMRLQFFAEPESKTAQLLAEFKEVNRQLKEQLDKQAEQIKTFGTTNDSTVNQIKSLEKNYEALETELKKLSAEFQRDFDRGQEEAKSIGAQFAASEEFKAYSGLKSGNSAPFRFKSFFKKDLTSATGSAGATLQAQRVNGIVTPPQRTTVRDLLAVANTNSNAIEFVEETGFTNAAAPQAGEGAIKAKSELTFELKNAPVRTIAHYIAASKQILDDNGQLQAYIDNRLIYGLQLEEERQVLFGDGTGNNLTGLMVHADVQNYGGVKAGDNILDTIRRAMTLGRVAEYPATGVILNPMDWEDIELMKGDDGHYIWINVNNGGEARLFKVPVVDTTAMTEGSFLTGAFGLGAQLFDREEANVRIAEQHADFFIRNMVAILAEERLAFPIYRPEAFVKGVFTPAV